MRRLLLVLLAGGLLATATSAATAAQPPAATTPAATSGGAAGGVQVGPPLPPAPQPPGGQVDTGGGGDHPFFLNIPGQIKKAIDDWFRGLVKDALNPTMELVGKTVLATPQVATQRRVAQLWQVALGIADAMLVLFVIGGGVIVMSHETVQTRHALKDILPRVALAAPAVNASLALCGQLITIANALSAGLLGAGVDPGGAADRLSGFVVAAISSGGIFLIFLGLACAVVAVILLVVYIVRAALIVLLVCAAPLTLLCHALPQTDGLARLWWRALLAALGIQVAQALVLTAAVNVFLTPDGRGALGLSATGGLVDLLVVLCLLWILIRIPFWAKDLAFSVRPSMVTRAAKTYVIAKVARAGALAA
ncbi:MAG TPA: conjugal transfer protein TrbL family protein [Solirubrobacteraceae bacterium]